MPPIDEKKGPLYNKIINGRRGRFEMRRKRKKRLILALILVFLAAAALSPFAVNAHVTHTAEAGIVTAEEAAAAGPADCVLVLGALVYPDGRLSAMLEDRVKTGISLYQSGAAKKLLFSGDHGREDYDEVNAMKRYALEAGVPEEDIFLDHAGFSTYESVYRAKAVFQVESVVIVTQRYHLYRALYTAQRLGLKAVGVDGALQAYVGQDKREFREFLARNKDFLFCAVKPKPTYLGSVIPISGDGRATRG